MRAVRDHQRLLQDQFEARPIEFLDRDRDQMQTDAREPIAAMLGMRRDDFVFIVNASEGINAVLRSIDWNRGDEILTTNHVYNAVRRTMLYTSSMHGVVPREVALPSIIHDPGDVTACVVDALTKKTRLVIIDHVTSPSALILPVNDIVRECEARGIRVLVDGAHAPGMIPINVDAIGADYYSANLHKWIGAPSGAAFLHVKPEHQADVHPNTISHFHGEGFQEEFHWQGTRDITPWLSVPFAIRHAEDVFEGGWPAIMNHNQKLAGWAHAMLNDAWGSTPRSPVNGCMVGAMATINVPPAACERFEDAASLQAWIMTNHAIEVPCMDLDDSLQVRVSCQLFNRPSDYELLASAVLRI